MLSTKETDQRYVEIGTAVRTESRGSAGSLHFFEDVFDSKNVFRNAFENIFSSDEDPQNCRIQDQDQDRKQSGGC